MGNKALLCAPREKSGKQFMLISPIIVGVTCGDGIDKEGISIPFPQRDVHLFQENAK